MTTFEGNPYEPLTLTLCLEEDSILVSKAILDILEQPRQVQMLINDEQKMLLLQACTIADREAVVIPMKTCPQFAMSGHSLLKRIRKLTGWTDNLPRVMYGDYLQSHKVIVFNLLLAQPSMIQLPTDSDSNTTN